MRTITCACLLLLALVCALISQQTQAEPLPQVEASGLEAELQAEPEARGQLQLPKLFDFDHYKQLFGKRYGSLLEELNRRRLVIARAFSSYVSGMKFKFRQQDHYESLNYLSDQSPAELDQLRNKLLAKSFNEDDDQDNTLLEVQDDEFEAESEALKVETAASESREDELMPEFLPSEDEDIETELSQLIEKHGDEPAYQELRLAFERRRQNDRLKREISDELDERELPQLINVGALEVEFEKTDSEVKIVARPESNNPNYEPLELPSFGLEDQQEQLKWWKIKTRVLKKEKISEQLYNSLIGLEPPRFKRGRLGTRIKMPKSDLPDLKYFDHRDSNCLFTPRKQGNCGSCYAFAAVAIMEWLHCTKTGELVAFSEQYLVDCGKGRFRDEMSGCHGSTDRAVGLFIHNFGMELRANYPYKARENQCPYDEDYDLKKTGYIRMELGSAVIISQAKWEKYISFQPLLIAIKTPPSFTFYGGGIYDGHSCSDEPDHAVVLVGHGRQNGIDYWLIRNSYSAGWGEGGYYKLAKAATKKCLEKRAFAFGSTDGKTHTLEIKKVEGGGARRPVVEDGYIQSLLNWVG